MWLEHSKGSLRLDAPQWPVSRLSRDMFGKNSFAICIFLLLIYLLLVPLINNVFPFHVRSPGSYGKEPRLGMAEPMMSNGIENRNGCDFESRLVSKNARVTGS